MNEKKTKTDNEIQTETKFVREDRKKDRKEKQEQRFSFDRPTDWLPD